jgi:hypothetical protein
MKIIAIVLTVFLGACASFPGANKTDTTSTYTPPVTPDAASGLAVEKEVQALSRAEVIAGINECEAAGLRPVVLSTKRRVNGQQIPAVVEVTCLPKIQQK